MIPFELLVFEQQKGKHRENYQRNHFLNHLQLQQGKWSSVFLITNFIRRYHQAILKKRNQPTGQNQPGKPGLLEEFQMLVLQVPIPGNGHEHIGKNKQENGVKSLHEQRSMCY